MSRSSKDDISEELILDSGEIAPEETESDYKPKSRELKEKIYETNKDTEDSELKEVDMTDENYYGYFGSLYNYWK